MPRITLYQGRPCGRIPQRHLERIRRSRPDLLCLPEYFWVPASARTHRDALAHTATARQALAELSRALDCVVVGGSYLVESEGRLYNTAPVHDRGRLVGEQRKVNPTGREREHGVAPGEDFAAIAARGLRLGVMICADALERTSFERMRELGVDLVCAPTLSPYLPGDSEAAKEERDRTIFAAGARRAGAPVVKVCGAGRIFGARLQGRSLVVAADGTLIARVPFAAEGRVQVMTVEV